MLYYINMKVTVFILLMICVQLNSQVRIEYGKEHYQIGVSGEGDSLWLPLFFDVDELSQIHIPDFYKERIVIYNSQGEVVKILPVSEGISPRMNFFSLNFDGTYTSFDNHTLYLLDEKGQIIWKHSWGLGVLPSHIYSDERGIFISLMDSEYYFFTYSSPAALGGVKDIGLSGLEFPEEGYLIYQEEGYYIWKEKEQRVLFWKEGEEKKIPLPGSRKAGHRVVYGQDRVLYMNRVSEKFLEIVTLGKGL